jgi:phosphate transport system substrate-binding protein
MNNDVPQGRCSNLPQHCELAKAQTLQDMPAPGAGCRICGMTLMDGRAQGLRRKFPTDGLVIALAAVGLVVAAYFGFSRPSKPANDAATASAPAESSSAQLSPEAERRDVLDSYLVRLSGSNTIGAKLAPDLAEAWLLDMGATDIETVQRKDDQGAKLPEKVVSGELDGKRVGVEIKAYGTAIGLSALRDGDADIWMASAPVTEEQAQALKDQGDMRGPASEHVIGLDGVAVIVSPTNPLSTLTKAQVKAIFTGAIKNWSELGQPAAPINLYARDAESGTRKTFDDMVLGSEDKMAPLAAAKPEGYADSEQLSDDVAADPHGVGFVGMPYIRAAKALTIKDGAGATALAPTVFTVRTESYPLTRRLYFYTAAQPSDDVKRFVTFALSESGQALAQKSVVGLTPAKRPARDADARPCQLSAKYPGDKRELCNLRAHAVIIDSSLRFRPASSELDTLAEANLDRVRRALKGARNIRVVLAGFADDRGGYKENCRLAKKRADTVKRELAARGVSNVEARGYCPELPIRDNAGEDYEQNRRVEVYGVETGP